MEKNIILSTAYLPPVDFFKSTGGSRFFWIDNQENYKKQSFRNRTNIYAPNGMQALIIPVLRPFNIPVKEVKIDYKMPWQRTHWRAIQTAYNNSPFFEYYQDYFSPFFHKNVPFLFDFNLELIHLCVKLLRKTQSIYVTENSNYYNESCEFLQNSIHPKLQPKYSYNTYNQVFIDKCGFIPNLSIIDLLFNLGPQSYSYIQHNLNTNE
jgi:hypothetical protein